MAEEFEDCHEDARLVREVRSYGPDGKSVVSFETMDVVIQWPTPEPPATETPYTSYGAWHVAKTES